MSPRMRAALSVFAFAALIVACPRKNPAPDAGLEEPDSGGVDAGLYELDPTGNFEVARDYCNRVAEAECQMKLDCGQLRGVPMHACLVNMSARICNRLSAVDAGAALFDLGAARELLDQYAALKGGCTDYNVFEYGHGVLFVANAGPGALCVSDSDCVDPATMCAGEGCAKRCLPKAVHDGACSPHWVNLRCFDPAQVCVDGYCRTPLDAGAPCNPLSDDFPPGGCGKYAYCNQGLCTPSPSSGPCGPWIAPCAEGRFCSNGQCVPFGNLCQSSDECAPDRFCSAGLCAPLLDAGEPCSGRTCAAGLFCYRGACSSLRNAGDACDAGDQCVFPLRCDPVFQECLPIFTGSLGADCSEDLQCNGAVGLKCVGADPVRIREESVSEFGSAHPAEAGREASAHRSQRASRRMPGCAAFRRSAEALATRARTVSRISTARRPTPDSGRARRDMGRERLATLILKR